MGPELNSCQLLDDVVDNIVADRTLLVFRNRAGRHHHLLLKLIVAVHGAVVDAGRTSLPVSQSASPRGLDENVLHIQS